MEEPEEKKDEAGDKDKPKPDKGAGDEEEDALPMPDEDVSINVRQDYTRNYTKARRALGGPGSSPVGCRPGYRVRSPGSVDETGCRELFHCRCSDAP